MNCVKCGAELVSDAEFCSHCGTPVTKILTEEGAIHKPVELIEEKEEIIWHGRRSYLDFLLQWLIAFLFLGLCIVSLVFRTPLGDYFNRLFSAGYFYTFFGWLAFALGLMFFLILVNILYHVFGAYYRLTNQRFVMQRGLIARRIDYIELWRVRDLDAKQNYLERIISCGDLQIISTDPTTPNLTVLGLRHPYKQMEMIRAAVNSQRAIKNVGIVERVSP